MEIPQRIKQRFKDKIKKFEEKALRRIYITFEPKDIPEAAEFLFVNLHCRFVTASGIDTPRAIEIIYHFSEDKSGKVISLRTFIEDKEKPRIRSLTSIIKGVEWIEREMHELLGIDFVGHPDLKHLLLVDDWPEGEYPLRKS
jgi:NADH-quinone oxidoreductase subunit C